MLRLVIEVQRMAMNCKLSAFILLALTAGIGAQSTKTADGADFATNLATVLLGTFFPELQTDAANATREAEKRQLGQFGNSFGNSLGNGFGGNQGPFGGFGGPSNFGGFNGPQNGFSGFPQGFQNSGFGNQGGFNSFSNSQGFGPSFNGFGGNNPGSGGSGFGNSFGGNNGFSPSGFGGGGGGGGGGFNPGNGFGQSNQGFGSGNGGGFGGNNFGGNNLGFFNPPQFSGNNGGNRGNARFSPGGFDGFNPGNDNFNPSQLGSTFNDGPGFPSFPGFGNPLGGGSQQFGPAGPSFGSPRIDTSSQSSFPFNFRQQEGPPSHANNLGALFAQGFGNNNAGNGLFGQSPTPNLASSFGGFGNGPSFGGNGPSFGGNGPSFGGNGPSFGGNSPQNNFGRFPANNFGNSGGGGGGGGGFGGFDNFGANGPSFGGGQNFGATGFGGNGFGFGPFGKRSSENEGEQNGIARRPQAERTVNLTEAECPACISADLSKLMGPWTQIYGNEQSMILLYSTLASLINSDAKSGLRIKPACVGMQIGRPASSDDVTIESPLKLYFLGDNTDDVFEENGTVKSDQAASRKSLLFNATLLSLPVCIVQAGPDTSTLYEYVVFTEGIGAQRCRNFHVFARRADTFFRDHNKEMISFLQQQLVSDHMNPVSVLRYPDQCETEVPQLLSRRRRRS